MRRRLDTFAVAGARVAGVRVAGVRAAGVLAVGVLAVGSLGVGATARAQDDAGTQDDGAGEADRDASSPPREDDAGAEPADPTATTTSATTRTPATRTPATTAPDEPPAVATRRDEAADDDLEAIEAALAEDREALEDSLDAGGTPEDREAGGAGQNMNPDLALIVDVALAFFSDQGAQLGTGEHDPDANGFHLQQLELSAASVVDPYFRLDGSILFSEHGVEIEEIFATTLDLPGGLQARAGQFLTRFGRINPTHPHAWEHVDQPLALGRVFGGEGNRGPGLELSWLTPLPWFVEVVASSTMITGEETARSFHDEAGAGVESPLDLQHTAALEQFFPLGDDVSLFVGLSTALGPSAAGSELRAEVYGADLYLKYRPITEGSHTVVSLTAEWLVRRREVPGDVLVDHTGLVQAFFRFAARWAAAARWELGTPARGGDGAVAFDPLDFEWTGDRHRASANLTFYPSEFSRLRLQGAVDVPSWLDEPICSTFLALEVVAGAHGAHTF